MSLQYEKIINEDFDMSILEGLHSEMRNSISRFIRDIKANHKMSEQDDGIEEPTPRFIKGIEAMEPMGDTSLFKSCMNTLNPCKNSTYKIKANSLNNIL